MESRTLSCKERGRFRRFRATKLGSIEARRIQLDICSSRRAWMTAYMQSLAQWALALDFAQIVKAVYRKYPGWDSKSIVSPMKG